MSRRPVRVKELRLRPQPRGPDDALGAIRHRLRVRRTDQDRDADDRSPHDAACYLRDGFCAASSQADDSRSSRELGVSVAAGAVPLPFVERQLKADLRDRLRDIGLIGAHLVDQAAYTRLVFQFGELDEARSSSRALARLRLISSQLRAVRRSEPDLIQYATSSRRPTTEQPRFVVDADVLDLRAKLAAGTQLGKNEKISHFNQAYDVSEIRSSEGARRLHARARDRLRLRLGVRRQLGLRLHAAHRSRGRTAPRRPGSLPRRARRRYHRPQDARGARRESSLALRLSLAAVALAVRLDRDGTVLTRSILALSSTG